MQIANTLADYDIKSEMWYSHVWPRAPSLVLVPVFASFLVGDDSVFELPNFSPIRDFCIRGPIRLHCNSDICRTTVGFHALSLSCIQYCEHRYRDLGSYFYRLTASYFKPWRDQHHSGCLLGLDLHLWTDTESTSMANFV